MEPPLGPVTVLQRAPRRFGITGEIDLPTAPRLDELGLQVSLIEACSLSVERVPIAGLYDRFTEDGALQRSNGE